MIAAAGTSAARRIGADLFAAMQARGALPVEAAVLQPAALLLDLYGEDIRARAYVTQDPQRGEMILRPDFTLPVVLAHMAEGAEPARYTYFGEVFRKQEQAGAARQAEDLQVGFELFDGADAAGADAAVFALFAQLLAPWGLRAAVGDIGLLRAAVQGLPISPARKGALMRHLWRPGRFRALVDRFAGRSPVSPARAALLAGTVAGGPQLGLRSAAEIAARVAALRADAAEPPLSGDLVTALESLLAVNDRAPAALAALRDLSGALPWTQGAVDALARRLDALAAQGVAVNDLAFEASYGRTTLEYYDGFVFGFYAPARPDLPLASGGRYDALTAVLGQGRAIPAVGGVIRPARLAALGAALGTALGAGT